VAATLRGVTALLVRPGYLPRSLLVRCHELRFYRDARRWSGQGRFPGDSGVGITVTYAPAANALGVAELTIAMALLLVRH